MRKYQLQKAQTVAWQSRDCQVLSMNPPTMFTIGNERVTVDAAPFDPATWDVQHWYVAFIRSPVKETPRAEDTQIKLHFSAKNDNRDNNWRGVIVRRDLEELKLTGTDFAALIRKPSKKERCIYKGGR